MKRSTGGRSKVAERSRSVVGQIGCMLIGVGSMIDGCGVLDMLDKMDCCADR